MQKPLKKKQKIHTKAPKKLTKAVIAKAASLRRKGVSIRDICLVIGTYPATFQDWMERGELKDKGLLHDFYVQLSAAEGLWAVDCCETISRASKDDWKAAAYWLRRKDPEYDPEKHYKEKKVDSEHIDEIEVKMTGMPDQDDEEREE